MNTSRLACPAKPCEVAHNRALVSSHPKEIFFRIPIRRIYGFALSFLIIVTSVLSVKAADVKLAWNANPETNITGYILSYGTSSRNYTGSKTTDNVTSTTVSGLIEGATYFFSIKAVNSEGLQSAASSEISYTVPSLTPSIPVLPTTGWSMVSVTSEETLGENGRAINAFDGNSQTFWHSQWSPNDAPPPHRLILDMGATRTIQGFRYLPRQDGSANGRVAQYEFHLSSDGVNWGTAVASGAFANNASEKEVLFPSANARFIRFSALTDVLGQGYCTAAELRVLQGSGTVLPVNQVPVASAQSVTTAEDTARALTLAGSDADGQALTYRIVSQPTRGRLSGTAPALTYTPSANANGSDSFSFVVNDGIVDSTAAVVSISVTAVNDAPVANNQTLNATAGTPLPITLTASDIDSTTLTYTVSVNPTKGTLSGTAPNLTYTPLAGQTGADSFTFIARDGTASSNTATVSLNIAAATNPSPLVVIPTTSWRLLSTNSQEVTAEDGRAINAFDGNPATFWHSLWSPTEALPPYEIRIDLGKSESIQGFRYLPRQDGRDFGNIGQYEFYISTDGINWGSAVTTGSFANSSTEKEVRFTSKAGRYIMLRAFNDVSGRPLCAVAELKLLQGTVVEVLPPPNVAPVASGQSISTDEDKALAIRLAATDANSNPLAYRVIDTPKMGILSGSIPDLTYTPNPDANGTDSFTFRANDGTADSNTATVSITIRPVNDAPLAQSLDLVTLEDKSVGMVLAGSDKDGDAFTYRLVRSPAKGKLVGTAPNLTYVPNPDVNGADSFTYVTHDGVLDSAVAATVSITINPANDAPVASARFVSTDANKSALIVLSASDKDGDVLSYSIINQPVKGVLSGTPPRVTYTPNPDAEGSDMLSFRVYDGTVYSNTASVSITLIPVVDPNANGAPEFQFARLIRPEAKVGETYAGTSLGGTAIDPDGDLVTYSRTSGPEWLSVAPDGSIGGTPIEGTEGMNRFTIRAADSEGAYSEVSLEIEVESNGLPLPWELAELGLVDPSSEASGDASAIRLSSSGLLAGKEDIGLYAWQTLTGDGEITVRIRELENFDTASRAGLMIRESLAANSKHTFIGTDGRGYVRWIRRTRSNGGTSTTSVAVTPALGVWLRLNRTGTTISAFTSNDSTSWTGVGLVNVELGASCYIGLSTHSGATDKLSAAVFENISVTP